MRVEVKKDARVTMRRMLMIIAVSILLLGVNLYIVILPGRIPEFLAAVLNAVFAAGIGIAAVLRPPRQPDSARKVSDIERVINEYRDIIVVLEEKNEYLINKWNALEKDRRSTIRDRAVATAIQRNILPREFPRSDEIKFSAFYKPIEGVGGDYYDVIELDDNNMFVFIADVAGHGISSALITAMLKAAAVSYTHRYPAPKFLMERINSDLSQYVTSAHFVTAVIAHINLETHTLTHVIAGHPRPLLMRKKEVIVFEGNNPVIGQNKDTQFNEETIQLCGGDKLLFYTDGAVELSRERSKRDAYGAARLTESFMAHSVKDIIHTVDGVKNDMMAYGAAGTIDDDLTLLGVEITRKRNGVS
ncbi:MAG: SpoIIE family protein phosphatase [Spirochaetes bacterium]|nr:SpoIIE family protein phosphatase [Spirochaetota bacterium]